MCLNFGAFLYKPESIDVLYIGPFRSLINHSCVPNISFSFVDNKAVTFVINPVKKVEQIFISYYDNIGPNQELNRKMCMQVLNFVCDCQLCIDNNHQYKPLKLFDPQNFMNRKHLGLAKELLKSGWHIINENDMPEDRTNIMFQCIIFLKILGEYATFPC